MSTVLLGRHGKATANERRSLAVGNFLSPLVSKGKTQSMYMHAEFKQKFGIDSFTYQYAVCASMLLRTAQTAEYAGFKHIDRNEAVNEADVSAEISAGIDVVMKHAQENWYPQELQEKAHKFVELVRSGDLAYQIYFTHGFFIANVVGILEEERTNAGLEPLHIFTDDRGYIPGNGTITSVEI